MVLPKKLDLSRHMATKKWDVKPQEHATGGGNGYGGIGYSRLCIQVVAYVLGLDFVWVIDDNVIETRQLDLGQFSEDANTHSKALPSFCKLWEPMRHIERLVDIGAVGQDPILDLEWEGELDSLGTAWKPYPDGHAGSKVSASNLQQFVGDSSSWGIVGMHRDWGKWKTIKKPFKLTYSVYSFFLLNVKATVEKRVLYAPKPIWEDIDFNFDLLHSELHVLKVNRWFHRKKNFQKPNTTTKDGAFSWTRAAGFKLEVLGGEKEEDRGGKRLMLAALSQCVAESTGASLRVPFVSDDTTWKAFEAHLTGPKPHQVGSLPQNL